MQNSAENRKVRLSTIRASLQAIPEMQKNSMQITKKIQCRAKRKESLKLESEGITEGEIDQILLADQKVWSISRLHEKYNIGDKIGEGSNGLVRKCYLKSTGEIFAVKSIDMEEEQIMFLKNNFKYIKSLSHPNIIRYQVMYLDNRKKTCYLIMDYDNNASLKKRLDLSSEQIRSIARQLMDTLAYIHSRNICHRDIKPENILYDEINNSIKIIDFGISKKTIQRGARREMLTITGTLFYRAPEMFFGGGYDERVDMWAAGITIYELITNGVTPFESEHLSTTIENIIRGEVLFSESEWGIYKFAKDLVGRLLRKRSERLTAIEAKQHLWFHNIPSPIDLVRSATFKECKFNLEKNKKIYFEESIDIMRSMTNQFRKDGQLDEGNGIQKTSILDDFKKWLSDKDDDVLNNESGEEEKGD